MRTFRLLEATVQMKLRGSALLALSAMLFVASGLAHIVPSYGAAAPPSAETAIRGIAHEYSLSSSVQAAGVSGTLVKRVADRRGRVVDAPLAGVVRLYLYTGERWAEQTRRVTGTDGSFSFHVTRRGRYEVRYAGNAATRPSRAPFPVYMDNLQIARPVFGIAVDGDGDAFVTLSAELTAPDADAFVTSRGENGTCQILITPVTDDPQPYNGPYAEGTIVVTENGTCTWGFTLSKQALDRYPTWRAVTYFNAGEDHRPAVRNDVFAVRAD